MLNSAAPLIRARHRRLADRDLVPATVTARAGRARQPEGGRDPAPADPRLVVADTQPNAIASAVSAATGGWIGAPCGLLGRAVGDETRILTRPRCRPDVERGGQGERAGIKLGSAARVMSISPRTDSDPAAAAPDRLRWS